MIRQGTSLIRHGNLAHKVAQERRAATRQQLPTLDFILGLCRREGGRLNPRLVCCGACMFSVRWTGCSAAQPPTPPPPLPRCILSSTGSACRYSVSLSKRDTNTEFGDGTTNAAGIIVLGNGASPIPACEISSSHGPAISCPAGRSVLLGGSPPEGLVLDLFA